MASSSNNPGGGKKSKGRQKIDIKKMENENNLQVTFSKRRAGLFKKASELCTLCGIEVALIVFSPGGKVFSFGHPNLEAVLDRFLTGGPPPAPPSGPTQMIEAHRSAAIRELNDQLTQLLEELEIEKKRGEELDMKLKDMEKESFLAQSVDTLNRDQIGIYKERLEEMKKDVYQQADQAAFRFVNDPSQFYVGAAGGGLPRQPPMMMMMMPNMAAPPHQVLPPPPMMQQPTPPLIQDPMMTFGGDMMVTSPQPMMMTTAQHPPPPAPPPAVPERLQQYGDMVVGKNSGGGFY